MSRVLFCLSLFFFLVVLYIPSRGSILHLFILDVVIFFELYCYIDMYDNDGGL